ADRRSSAIDVLATRIGDHRATRDASRVNLLEATANDRAGRRTGQRDNLDATGHYRPDRGTTGRDDLNTIVGNDGGARLAAGKNIDDAVWGNERPACDTA